MKEVAASPTAPTKLAPFTFATTPEAIKTNEEVLARNGFDLERALSRAQDTTLGYGSEFRPLDQLEIVLGGHPEFGVLAGLIENGMSYHFKQELSEDARTK